MASGTGIGLPGERRGVTLHFHTQPGPRSEAPAKDALYRETLQTTGRTTRVLNRHKRVCVDRQAARSVPRTVARRQCALPGRAEGPLPTCVFSGITESIGPIGAGLCAKARRFAATPCRAPRVRPFVFALSFKKSSGARSKARSRSSSAMSSGRLFLDRVARQQSPSPLHRHPQSNTHSQHAQAKDDISTLPGRRHFYFALTPELSMIADPRPR
jgi:hypothetical protein